MEWLEFTKLFAGAHEFDGLASDCAHGKRCAAAPVAIEPCQDDAGDADGFVEGFRDIDRVLSRQ